MKNGLYALMLLTLASSAIKGDTPERERIRQKYNLSAEKCLPVITPLTLDDEAINHQFSCFITGNTPIFYAQNLSYLQLKQKLNSINKPLIDEVGSNYYEFTTYVSSAVSTFYPSLIVYHPDVEQNALLLQKYLLESSLLILLLSYKAKSMDSSTRTTIQNMLAELSKTSKVNSAAALPLNNEYLIGQLLGYSDPQLKLLYQQHAFLQSNEPSTQSGFQQGYTPLQQWPAEQQTALKTYLASSKEWELSFNEEKTAAEQWLSFNKKYTNKQLEGACSSLLQPILWFEHPESNVNIPQSNKVLKDMIKLRSMLPRIQEMIKVSQED